MYIFAHSQIVVNMYSMKKQWLAGKMVTCLLFLYAVPAMAQNSSDTLVFNIQQAEKRFIDSNLQLLASHYNVDAQQALIKQARLWDNPVLNTDQVVWADKQFFHYSKNPDGTYNGQYYVQLQQLISTGGKRGKLVKLATTNAKISELQLQDLLRNLRYQLHTDYYNVVMQLGTRAIYQNQLQQLNKLQTAMQAQLNTGNIAQKDFLRIQALVISLEQDITELDKTIADNQSELKTLLQISGDGFIKPTESLTANVNINTTPDVLTETAKQNNPYYGLLKMQTTYQQQNLAYQKSLRVPDITLGPNFDHNSNFTPNYVGLGISLPLPVLNKNQGNIKAAEYNVKQQQTLTLGAETELRNNITNAYNKLQLSLKQNNATQKEFYIKYQAMYQNIVKSYQEKQINLLEFLDFFNDYTDSQQRLLQQQLNLQLAKEELNYHAGTDIVK